MDKASIESIQKSLTPTSFGQWIHQHDRDEVVGERAEDCGCPLSCYLESVGGEQISVRKDAIVGVRNERIYFGNPEDGHRPVPLWVAVFIDRIDWKWKKETPAITASMASIILKETLATLF